jgi:DNA replication protein DnaC
VAERQRETLLKLAALPAVKTLEQYDFAVASSAPRLQIQELANLAFIGRNACGVVHWRARRDRDHLA